MYNSFFLCSFHCIADWGRTVWRILLVESVYQKSPFILFLVTFEILLLQIRPKAGKAYQDLEPDFRLDVGLDAHEKLSFGTGYDYLLWGGLGRCMQEAPEAEHLDKDQMVAHSFQGGNPGNPYAEKKKGEDGRWHYNKDGPRKVMKVRGSVCT
jgi:hypothetical protein